MRDCKSKPVQNYGLRASKLKSGLFFGFGLGLILGTAGYSFPASAASEVSPDQALTALKEGNKRYLAGVQKYPKNDPARRARTASEGQEPMATVLGCSDARVPVEIVFDKAFGDIFVVRVAGNVCQMAELASIEYGVNYLHTPLVVVLGHSKCGAVAAAVDEASLSGSLPRLIEEISPAVSSAKKKNPSADAQKLVDLSIEENVRKSISDIRTGSETIKKAEQSGKVKIVGAVRDIANGTIRWLSD